MADRCDGSTWPASTQPAERLRPASGWPAQTAMRENPGIVPRCVFVILFPRGWRIDIQGNGYVVSVN